MRFVISPAKKMNVVDGLPWEQMPAYVDRARRLLAELRSLAPGELKGLWRCSDALAALNCERVRTMDLDAGLTPAVLAYEGIQYQAMAPSVMTDDELDYLRRHLRILSGFYGVLRPFDGVVPYRLEMQAKLAVDGNRDLYGFWGPALYDALVAEGVRVVVNLASVEYARAVTPYVEPPTTLITCLFGRERDGRLVQKATEAKAARGSFVRWCAERGVEDARGFADFDAMGFSLNQRLSQEDALVFTRP